MNLAFLGTFATLPEGDKKPWLGAINETRASAESFIFLVASEKRSMLSVVIFCSFRCSHHKHVSDYTRAFVVFIVRHHSSLVTTFRAIRSKDTFFPHG
jgi:hypothetical protein